MVARVHGIKDIEDIVMQKTSIGWTDFSANLLKYRNAEGETVWACVHTSEGCRFCYSEALAKRWGRGEAFTAENMKLLTPFFDEEEALKVFRSAKIEGQKVFVDDMTDLFGEWVSDEIIDRHFFLFGSRPKVTFQVLTKRAKRMHDYVNAHLFGSEEWPLRNVHLGVSVEDQKSADERIPLLIQTPAAICWLSIEPLLSNIHWCGLGLCCSELGDYLIDGIVIGGESGPNHRQMPLDCAVSLARKARAAGVAVYFKQDSGPRPGMQGRVPDDVWAMKDWATSEDTNQHDASSVRP